MPQADRDSISLATATSITIANMIGTGVFTSLGFQVVDIRSGFSLLLLWVVGGVLALCGALCYAELGAALPRSGGELNFLSRIYHPGVGFLFGWVSVTVGFGPPIALAAMAFGRYFARVVPGASPLVVSCVVVALVTAVHLRDLRLGAVFQNTFTLFKVLLILVFIGAALAAGEHQPISFAPTAADLGTAVSAPFAISLMFVMFAYTGWNASVYVIDEVRDPTRTVPRSLVLGTAVVLVLYVGLNWAFLASAPIDELRGQIEVGHVAATHVFGAAGGRLLSALLCVALVSTISAMTWAGPRVTQVMGQDFTFFRALARTNAHGIPQLAILVQTAIVFAMLLTGSFERILVYTQFTLALSSLLTVVGVFVLRARAPKLPRPYRTWGYPVTPLLFALISLFALGYSLTTRPVESLAGLATVLVGLPLYLLSPRTEKPAEGG